MIRATALSVVDQAMLSAVNFALALVLIRYATPEEYGLYTQLIGLQALFSVLHAGLFVSAFLATLPRLTGDARIAYRSAMSRAEILVTLGSMVLVAGATWLAASWLHHPLSFAVSAASAGALLSLWWREFVRAHHFAELAPGRVLRVDTFYSVLAIAGVGVLVGANAVNATNVLWCIGLAGALVTLAPILQRAREHAHEPAAVRAQVAASWKAARWEVATSLVTWAHAQTFVFFAAAQGGLRGAAQISAARLLAMPLSLVWASYANVLRPSASRLFDRPDARRELARLARRSVLFVLGFAGAYSLLLLAARSTLDRLFFGDRFEGLGFLTALWLVHFSLTGLTTIAASVLRSGLEFRTIFGIHAVCACSAVACSFAGLAFATPAAFIIVLIGAEMLLASLLWRRLRARLRDIASLPPGTAVSHG